MLQHVVQFECLIPGSLSFFAAVQNRKHQKGKGGEMVDGLQPPARFDYNKKIGGVDVFYQCSGTYSIQHRPRNFLWRRVLDQNVFLAIMNACLIYSWWLTNTIAWCNAELARMDEVGLEEPNDVVPDDKACGSRGQTSCPLNSAWSIWEERQAVVAPGAQGRARVKVSSWKHRSSRQDKAEAGDTRPSAEVGEGRLGEG